MELNVIIVGNAGVGKTSYIKRLKGEGFERRYLTTFGSNNNVVNVHTTKGDIEFNITDTAGQEKFGGIVINADINAAFVMLDVTSIMSMKAVSWWIRSIRSTRPSIPIILLANKIDINSGSRKVPTHSLIECCNELRLSAYFELSVKLEDQITEPFIRMKEILSSNI